MKTAFVRQDKIIKVDITEHNHQNNIKAIFALILAECLANV